MLNARIIKGAIVNHLQEWNSFDLFYYSGGKVRFDRLELEHFSKLIQGNSNSHWMGTILESRTRQSIVLERMCGGNLDLATFVVVAPY